MLKTAVLSCSLPFHLIFFHFLSFSSRCLSRSSQFLSFSSRFLSCSSHFLSYSSHSLSFSSPCLFVGLLDSRLYSICFNEDFHWEFAMVLHLESTIYVLKRAMFSYFSCSLHLHLICFHVLSFLSPCLVVNLLYTKLCRICFNEDFQNGFCKGIAVRIHDLCVENSRPFMFLAFSFLIFFHFLSFSSRCLSCSSHFLSCSSHFLSF